MEKIKMEKSLKFLNKSALKEILGELVCLKSGRAKTGDLINKIVEIILENSHLKEKYDELVFKKYQQPFKELEFQPKKEKREHEGMDVEDYFEIKEVGGKHGKVEKGEISEIANPTNSLSNVPDINIPSQPKYFTPKKLDKDNYIVVRTPRRLIKFGTNRKESDLFSSAKKMNKKKMVDSTCTQNFKSFMEHNLIYIDKSKYLIDLLSKNEGCFILNCPRRSGKTLFLNTIRAFFEESLMWWQTYAAHLDLFKNRGKNVIFDQGLPVFYCSLGTVRTTQTFRYMIGNAIYNLIVYCNDKWFHSDPLPAYEGKELRKMLLDFPDFLNYINHSIQEIKRRVNKQIVVLIDEYDSPMLNIMFSELSMDYNRKKAMIEEFLQDSKEFYSLLKNLHSSSLFRMILLIGPTRLAKQNVFSQFNIGKFLIDKNFYKAMGFTLNEIKEFYSEQLKMVADDKFQGDVEKVINEIKYYDGHLHDPEGDEYIYNPNSINSYFSSEGTLRPYFAETGNTKMAVSAFTNIKKMTEDVANYELLTNFLHCLNNINNSFQPKKLPNQEPNTWEEFMESPILILFFGGYLTFSLEKKGHLKIPNEELRLTFMSDIFDKIAMYDYLTEFLKTNMLNSFIYSLGKIASSGFMSLLERHRDLSDYEFVYNSLFSIAFDRMCIYVKNKNPKFSYYLNNNIQINKLTGDSKKRVDFYASLNFGNFKCKIIAEFKRQTTKKSLVDEAVTQIFSKKYYEIFYTDDVSEVSVNPLNRLFVTNSDKDISLQPKPDWHYFILAISFYNKSEDISNLVNDSAAFHFIGHNKSELGDLKKWREISD